MLMPSTPVVVAALAALAILLGLAWMIGGIAYNRKPASTSATNSPASGKVCPIKEAA